MLQKHLPSAGVIVWFQKLLHFFFTGVFSAGFQSFMHIAHSFLKHSANTLFL